MTSSPLVLPGRRVRQVILAALCLAICRTAAADPLAEIKTVSGLEGLDAQRLKRGEILTARGTQGSFPRGVYAESCYFLQAAPDTVKTTLLHWDPSRYKATEVNAYRTYRWPSTPDVFKTLVLDAKVPADRTLLDWTAEVGHGGAAGELHLRPEDVPTFRQGWAGQASPHPPARDSLVNTAWQQLLQQHSDAVGNGGFEALPAYRVGGATIQAANEFKSLLKMSPDIARRFAPLTGTRPLFADGSGNADETVPYAEESQVRGHTSFCLGVMATLRMPDGWLALDCTYYTADTYFFSVALYQMWPWENGTLVWEVDYASAPFRSYLGGIDRVFAGKEMTKDTTQAVQTFRQEIAAQGR